MNSSNLEVLNILPRLLNTIIHLIRIRALADSSRRSRLAASLTANDLRDLGRPVGSGCSLGGKVL